MEAAPRLCDFCLEQPATLRLVRPTDEREVACTRECPESIGVDRFKDNMAFMLFQLGKNSTDTNVTILYPSDVDKSSWFLAMDGRHTTKEALLEQIMRGNVQVASLDSTSHHKGVLVATGRGGTQIYVRPGNEYQPHRWLNVPAKPSSSSSAMPVAWRLPALGTGFKTVIRDKKSTGNKSIELPKGQFSVYAPQTNGSIREELASVRSDLMAICAEMDPMNSVVH